MLKLKNHFIFTKWHSPKQNTTSFFNNFHLSKLDLLPPGFKATAAFFSAAMPVNRAKVPGRASDDVENIIGITPELFTCLIKTITCKNNQLQRFTSPTK